VKNISHPSADHSGAVTLPVEFAVEAIDGLVTPAPSRAAERLRVLRRQLGAADVVAGATSGMLSGALGGLPLQEAAALGLALAVLWPLLAFVSGLYASDDLRSWASGVSEAPKLLMAAVTLSWPAFGILSAFEASNPVAGALAAAVLTAGSTGLARAAARMQTHRAPELRQRTLIVGSGIVARSLVERLRRHDELGLDPVGFIDEGVSQNDDAVGLERLGSLEALPGLIRARRVDRVMIAFSRAGHEELLHCIRVCRDGGVAVDVVPRLFEFLDGARTLDRIGGMPLLSINAPALSPLSRAAKRGLDLLGASLALLTLSPMLAVVAIAIRIDSKGPVLFTQPRAGRGGRFFTLYKFRSMQHGSGVLVRDDGAIVKQPDDTRITRMGKIIRRLSLDEAPQLLNVLKGEMSLVGPRPLVIAEAQALTEEWQGRRADLRPGLTGPWQISGRSHIPFQEMIKFDYQYVAGWSLARDVEILLATIPAVLSGRGAY
jgi:exopolysaccharide biosynthesis polyprenyl glycosylphosphotransferase